MTGESAELVNNWIKLHEIIKNHGNDSDKAESLFWAFEELDAICAKEPEIALKLIIQILASTKDEYILANLAAGPLETLLARHGKEIVPKIERIASDNLRFRNLLKGIWQNQIDDYTWSRILKACNK